MSYDSRSGLQELCTFIPYLEDVAPDKVCQWKGGEGFENGSISFPYPEYDEEFRGFLGACSKSIPEFQNYQDELDRRVPNWATTDIIKVIETADFDLVRVIFTKCIRVERFCGGAWHSALKDGIFLALLQRIKVLLNI